MKNTRGKASPRGQTAPVETFTYVCFSHSERLLVANIVICDNAFWIESFVFEDYREDIQRSINDVASVEHTFREFCKIYKIEAENDSNAIFRFIEQNRADISYYLCHTDKEAEKHNTLAAQFVDTFRNTPQIFDKLKDMYLVNP